MTATALNEADVFIGFPVYNGEDYVETALRSLLAQTYSNFKILISDNASTDRTAEICKAVAAADNRVEYVRQSENLGPIGNFRFALAAAQGRYFMWAADDDLWDPKFLEKLILVLEGPLKPVSAFSYYQTFRYADRRVEAHTVIPSNSKSKVINAIIRAVSMHATAIYGVHRLQHLKKMTLDQFDLFDVHLINRLSLEGSFEIVPEFLFTGGIKPTLIGSLTGRQISRTTFLTKEFKLYTSRLPVLEAFLVMAIVILQAARQWLSERRASEARP